MPFYYPYYYGFDWTYLYLLLPCIILSLWASSRVNRTFKRYSSQLSARHITGEQAAMRVLQNNGLSHIRIEKITGNLTDHYDPKHNVIRLSESVYSSTSTAAIGVACHEAGHAIQYAQNYFPIKIRTAIIPVTNIGSKLAMPLILLGILFSTLGNFSTTLVYLGIFSFSFSLIFQLITLPVEFNASRRALRTIQDSNMLTDDEIVGARKTLKAAAMTYVAAVAVSLAQLLRLIMLFGGRNRRNR